jgi:hypothetical protein
MYSSMRSNGITSQFPTTAELLVVPSCAKCQRIVLLIVGTLQWRVVPTEESLALSIGPLAGMIRLFRLDTEGHGQTASDCVDAQVSLSLKCFG